MFCFFSFLEVHLTHWKVVHCISRFEGTSYKKLQDIATSFFICCFTSAFTSADIIFATFLNLIQNYQQKKVTNFPFKMDAPNPLPPFSKSAKCEKGLLLPLND